MMHSAGREPERLSDPDIADASTQRPCEPASTNGSSSVAKVVFNYINAVVGSGILAIPYALHQAGLVTGLALAAVVGILTDYTVRLLVRTGVQQGVRNYEELMDKLYGTNGYVVISLLMFAYDFGAMLSYLIILADVSSSVVYEICTSLLGMSGQGFLSDHWDLRRVCLLAIALTLVLPLCLHRDISGLEKASKWSVITTVLVILIVMGAAIAGDNCPDRDLAPASCPDTEKPWLTLLGPNPSAAFGILAFAFVSHDTAFMFHNSLKDQSKWDRTTHLSLLFSVIICLTFAIPGYLAFRDKIEQNLLNNFAPDDYKIMFVRILFMLTMSATYPICFFICRHIVNELAFRWERRAVARVPGTPAGVGIEHVSKARHYALTLTLFFASLTIACFVDKLGFVMSLTGNISAVSIAFILPPLCAIKGAQLEASECRCTTRASREGLDTGLLDDHHVDEAGVHATRRARSKPCAKCAAKLRSTYWTSGPVFIFGLFTLVFCTAQTIAAG